MPGRIRIKKRQSPGHCTLTAENPRRISAERCAATTRSNSDRHMLLKKYTLEIFRPECNASFQSLHCHAHLEQDISEAIPYLNAVLGGTGFTKSPLSVMFQIHGRLIAVHPDRISINALKDAGEAEKVVAWMKAEINDACENRHHITPQYAVAKKPQPLEVLRFLPKTNCQQCGQPTCLVFSTLAVQGVKGPDDCPPLAGDNKRLLTGYLSQFNFIDFQIE